MSARDPDRATPGGGDVTDDGFLGGRLRILQPRGGYRAGIDPVLLAAAVPARPGESVLDLGCGVGTAALCLGWRVAELALSGLELQPDYAALARQNAARNGIAFGVHEGDLGQMPPALRRAFDHVIANPPYFAHQGGTPARDAGRETALREATPIALWMASAGRRLRPGGHLTLVQLAERLPDVLAALGPGFGSVVVLPVVPRADRPATRILLRARKGGRGAFRLLSPLVLHEGPAHDGDRESFRPEVSAVLRDGAALAAFG
mgnify:CR=1 FL=1